MHAEVRIWSGWLYSLEFIALVRLQECIAERMSEGEGKTQSCGRWSFRFSNQLHGRNTLRSGCRTDEGTSGRAAATEIKGGPSNAPARHCLPHTRIREIRVSKASHPISATNGYTATIRCGAGDRRAENYADLSGGMAAANKSVSLSRRPAT